MRLLREKFLIVFIIITPVLISYCISIATALTQQIPVTVSREAQSIIKMFTLKKKSDNKQMEFPDPSDLKAWKQIQEKADDGATSALSKEIVSSYQPTLIKTKIGGINVVDIRPQGWHDNGKVLVYTHGGAYTFLHADNTLNVSVPVAHECGLRIVAVDYTLAPFATYEQITDEVIRVVDGLLKKGYKLKDIGLFGDSSGGGLAASVALKLRDRGIGIVGALVVWSPWTDLTGSGDSYFTLKDYDFLLCYKNQLEKSATAYAEVKKQRDPYASPVYGNFRNGFPPTLIQAGTREIFLSDAVRLYQRIDTAGQFVKLDKYEGMWHVFQAFPDINIPEAQIARAKMVRFLKYFLAF